MFSGKGKTGKRISAEGHYVKSKKQQHIEGVGTVNLEVLRTFFFLMFDPLVSNEVSFCFDSFLGIATTQFWLQQKKPRRFFLVRRQYTLMSLQKEQSDQCISRGHIEASMSEVAPK